MRIGVSYQIPLAGEELFWYAKSVATNRYLLHLLREVRKYTVLRQPSLPGTLLMSRVGGYHDPPYDANYNQCKYSYCLFGMKYNVSTTTLPVAAKSLFSKTKIV